MFNLSLFFQHKKNIIALTIFLILSLFITVFFSLKIGRISVSWSTLFTFFTHPNQLSFQDKNILLHLRLPRILAALLIGAALSISGCTYQSLFQNTLATPELLGVFHGACVGAASAILLSSRLYIIQIFALFGGLIAVSISVSFATLFKQKSATTLVLSGIIVTGFMRSILGILKFIADPETQLPAITYWEMGSLATVSFSSLLKITPLMLISFFVLYFLRYRLNILRLGQQEALLLGENVAVLRLVFIFFSTLLTSCAICLGGNIMWIGLMIPQLARFLVGSNHVRLFPIVSLMGSIFLIFIDTLARSLRATELPLSVLTGIIGTPLFILLMFYEHHFERR